MTLIVLLLLAGLSAIAFSAGRRKARRGARGHSRPHQQGTYVALWAGVPAAILLIFFLFFGAQIEYALLSLNPPPEVLALSTERIERFYGDARALAFGAESTVVSYSGELRVALEATAAEARRIHQVVIWSSVGLAIAIALAGFSLAYRRLSPDFRARNRVEGWMSGLLVICSLTALATTIGIVASLALEAFRFFQAVSIFEFLFGTEWNPQATGDFGALPLFVGTFLIMAISMVVAAPIGLMAAIYLSEYANPKTRAVVKPLLEILAGIPTVVYGYFAALTVGPMLRSFFHGMGGLFIGGPLNGVGEYLMQTQNQMALTAGVVMGIMLIPFVSSLSDDIINAVPQSMRDGSLAMGATHSETVKRVILPAALPGIMGAMLLGVSRAIGETMIVKMAAGGAANLSLNPLDTVTTVTYQIVDLLTGDLAFDGPETLSAFGLGLTLFVMTLCLNLAAMWIVQKYQEQYD